MGKSAASWQKAFTRPWHGVPIWAWGAGGAGLAVLAVHALGGGHAAGTPTQLQYEAAGVAPVPGATLSSVSARRATATRRRGSPRLPPILILDPAPGRAPPWMPHRAPTAPPATGTTAPGAFGPPSALAAVAARFGIPLHLNTQGRVAYFYAGQQHGVAQVAKYSAAGALLGTYAQALRGRATIGSIAGGQYRAPGTYTIS